MYRLLRPLLFSLPPEAAHKTALSLCDLATRLRLQRLVQPAGTLSLPTRLMGLDLANPVGLAAGLDKNGDHIDALAALGFGFLEIGTLTPRPQPGNPKPRLFRLPEERAIINRMGFNNKGLDYAINRVQHSRYRGVLGINIGKNADTPMERAADDYLAGMRKAWPLAGYLVINLSSPNTPGLRDLQFGDELQRLLVLLKSEQQKLAEEHAREVPLLIKIAPDLDEEQLELIADTFLENHIEGVIATNTSVGRHGVEDNPLQREAGGLSGAPLMEASTGVIRRLAGRFQGRIPIIGAGGISSGEDARRKIEAGASAVQIYTGFIYQGPALVAEAVRALQAMPEMEKEKEA